MAGKTVANRWQTPEVMRKNKNYIRQPFPEKPCNTKQSDDASRTSPSVRSELDWAMALDTRLSADTHWLLKLLVNFPPGTNPTVEKILELYNTGRSRGYCIGVKRIRRMTKELKAVGYLTIGPTSVFHIRKWVLTLPGSEPVTVGSQSNSADSLTVRNTKARSILSDTNL